MSLAKLFCFSAITSKCSESGEITIDHVYIIYINKVVARPEINKEASKRSLTIMLKNQEIPKIVGTNSNLSNHFHI
jgi:hypothetical protein